uniref:Secreted protein n=1 Tax=Strongyloides venezuelensis TaxID=75913 RepID=A0A0K0ETZ3_STRVS
MFKIPALNALVSVYSQSVLYSSCIRSFAEKVTLETKFEPSLPNSSVYFFEIALQISTFVFNFRRQPSIERLFKNKSLKIFPLFAC